MLKDVLRSLAAIQKGIPGIRATYAGMPESLKSLPCIFNVPNSGELNITFGGGSRHTIFVRLIVDRAALPQSQDRLLEFLEPVILKLSEDSTLAGSCSTSQVIRYFDYGQHEYAGVDYFGVGFELECIL